MAVANRLGDWAREAPRPNNNNSQCADTAKPITASACYAEETITSPAGAAMLHILRTSSCTSKHLCCVCYFILVCAGERQDRIPNYFASVRFFLFGVCGSPPGCVCMRALLGGVPEPPADGLVGGGQWQEGEEQAPSALSPGAGRQSTESIECVGDSRGYFFSRRPDPGYWVYITSSARATAHYFFCPAIKLVP